MPPLQLKELYKADEIHKAFYTGGDLQWSEDGSTVYCSCNGCIQILNVNEGRIRGSLGEEENTSDPVLTFLLDNNNEQIFSAHKSGLLKIWNLQESEVIKQWKSIHKGPVSRLAINLNSTILASGGSDSSIRIWDLQYNCCKHKLIGLTGVVSVLEYFRRDNIDYLFGAADDTNIHVWDVESGVEVLTLVGHYSTVTGVVISQEGNHVASCSRDKVIILWDFKTGRQLHVIPVFESVESLVFLPKKFIVPESEKKVSGGLCVATGGEKGVIRIWDVCNVSELYCQQNSLIESAKEDSGLAITHLIYNKLTNSFLVSSVDHNLLFYNFDTFTCTNQLIGFSDQVLDIISIGEECSHIVVATNSNFIKLYQMSNMNCQLLKGHSDLVVCLASTPANPSLFASSSKDNSIRVWLLENGIAHCVASGMMHNSSVGAVSISQLKSHFLISASQDTVMKKWKLPSMFDINEQPISLTMKAAKVSHEKDINGIAVSPNDKLIATASMDKTAKLWSSADLTLLGTLRGHKRGVWSVTFSPSDQVLLTSSADTTLKIWSISDLSCLKTFEGHESSVLKSSFLTHGLQIVSCGGDGLLKLWNVKTGECSASFDHHDGKIWALAVLKGEATLVTGGDDSQLVIWRDYTEQVKLEKAQQLQEKTHKEQQLANYLQSEDLLNALRLALSLNRPATVLNIFQEIISRGETGVIDTVKQLNESDKHLLLKCASHWNANSKFCYPAQVVLSLLLDEIALGDLKVSKELIESISAYTDRHFKRLTQLTQDLNLLEYTKAIMKPHYVHLS
ncbi:hypothetical protein O3M35_002763 [Rhynocoris fuscipes]|uniref:U3 small nucleolar RNA-associated protein 13 C-terminal domain-containing protein n=1 Tax=Rhynocoris fuscipes TaxID=488301 RepID=A0AAW1CPY9_9HEMI